ncbi:hypothetical protein AVEN_26638-1 [Araneus ventricosus]|uniref:Uncharacterized protein n=1 Tax=Araneus ventricosus TaxID=182803 RepID=A0A4Y2NG47_ARAVE|nr:hypothetical protein AVEN_26638-1 [Araneus ventricosus]
MDIQEHSTSRKWRGALHNIPFFCPCIEVGHSRKLDANHNPSNSSHTLHPLVSTYFLKKQPPAEFQVSRPHGLVDFVMSESWYLPLIGIDEVMSRHQLHDSFLYRQAGFLLLVLKCAKSNTNLISYHLRKFQFGGSTALKPNCLTKI